LWEGFQVPPFAVFLRVASKMEVKMNTKMKMIKMSVEYWCNDAERENFGLPLCPHKAQKVCH
jgi:hypothetical protein